MTLQLKLTEVKFGEESPIGFKPAHRALIDRLPNLKGARREHIFSIPTRFKINSLKLIDYEQTVHSNIHP